MVSDLAGDSRIVLCDPRDWSQALTSSPTRPFQKKKKKRAGNAEDKTMDSFNTATLGPHEGLTGYFCRHYWWQNEAHQFPAVSTMTYGISPPPYPPKMAFGLHSCKNSTSKSLKDILYFICHWWNSADILLNGRRRQSCCSSITSDGGFVASLVTVDVFTPHGEELQGMRAGKGQFTPNGNFSHSWPFSVENCWCFLICKAVLEFHRRK